MATVVEAAGTKIFIDPGASLAPRRYGLPPHPVEMELLEKTYTEILGELMDSEYVIITHYHRDHYLYRDEHVEAYTGKKLLVKSPERLINPSQRVRAYILFKKMGVEKIAGSVEVADNTIFRQPGLTIEFSQPVPHGPEGTRLGWVLMVKISSGGETFIHTSDVQGPMSDKSLEIISSWKPTKIFLCGPPTYFEGYKMREEDIARGLENMGRLLLISSLREVIIDHHLLRDINYRAKINYIVKEAERKGVRILTAAEYMGRPINQLESRRKELWQKE